ncbi:MAG TPA: class I SAM-dependent methyltransferase [Pseudolabrys sp.]|nr:class I SAM-dependent methyltransferase [Pseudolabrys sp.]
MTALVMAIDKSPADPFAAVREATVAHRAHHKGCGAYPYGNGPLLGALAAAANARRILELGTALGYTALWFARGAPEAVIDTIDHDADHVHLAREQVEAHGMTGHIVVHQGEFAQVLRRLDPGYDIAFFDGFTPTRPVLRDLRRLLRTRGLLISANLTHKGADAYLAALQDRKTWETAFVDGERETALSIKL